MKKEGKQSVDGSKNSSVSTAEGPDYWVAMSAKHWKSGRIYYDKHSCEYSAFYFEHDVLFSKLASANYGSEDNSPLNEYGHPKAEFLLLLALRESFPTNSPGRKWRQNYWKEIAFKAAEIETKKRTGQSFSDKNRELIQNMISSFSEFEKYMGSRFAVMAGCPNAGNSFRRLAGWLDAIDRIEEIGIPANDQRFITSIEKAAAQVGGVPTQKAVREIFEKDLSANQKGAGSTFRSLMIKLKFNWLPIAGRGTALIQKKSGI